MTIKKEANLFDCIPDDEIFFETTDTLFKEKLSKFPNYDYRFIWIGMYAQWLNQKDCMKRIYSKCSQYLDKDFLICFPKKNQYSARLWELFLCDFLLTKNFLLSLEKKKKWTPDFLISFEGKKIWIESTTPSRTWDVEELTYNKVYNLADASKSRYLALLSSLHFKSEQWTKVYLNNWCQHNDCFVVAINWNEIDSYIADKWIVGPLYGVWLTQFNRDWEISYQKLEWLEKKSGTIISPGLFFQSEYSHISGVIYLETNIRYENDDLIVENDWIQIIPNINAKNPLPSGFIEKLWINVIK